jgi:hypothetical protein
MMPSGAAHDGRVFAPSVFSGLSALSARQIACPRDVSARSLHPFAEEVQRFLRTLS